MYYYDVIKPEDCSGPVFDKFLSLGWYPMGQSIFTTSHLFREDGGTPPKVFWLRYPVDEIRTKASHRRIYRKNKAFQVQLTEPFEHMDELDSLYEKYLGSVDFDGYSSIEKASYPRGGSNIFDSKALILRQEGRIFACGIFYEGFDSAASILHFYDPDFHRCSPGKYLILLTLEYCRNQGFQWYYPGYVVQGNRKMDYKLFLGENTAQFYLPEPDPLSGSWEPFHQALLLP